MIYDSRNGKYYDPNSGAHYDSASIPLHEQNPHYGIGNPMPVSYSPGAGSKLIPILLAGAFFGLVGSSSRKTSSGEVTAGMSSSSYERGYDSYTSEEWNKAVRRHNNKIIVPQSKLITIDQVYFQSGTLADACLKETEFQFRKDITGDLWVDHDKFKQRFSLSQKYSISAQDAQDLHCLSRGIEFGASYVETNISSYRGNPADPIYHYPWMRFAELWKSAYNADSFVLGADYSRLSRKQQQFLDDGFSITNKCAAIEHIMATSNHPTNDPVFKRECQEFSELCKKNIDLLIELARDKTIRAFYNSWAATERHNLRQSAGSPSANLEPMNYQSWRETIYLPDEEKYTRQRNVLWGK